MSKYISGLPTQNNLDKWASYAKRNSYGDNKAQCREQLAPAGRHDREDDWIPNSGDWQEPQKQSEGRGYADMRPTTADNTYTTNKGSKRG
jgi:hypothetical protein